MGANDKIVGMAEIDVLKQRVAELERSLSRKILENDILKAAVELARKKTDLARALVRDRGFGIGKVAAALKVSRSNLYERMEERPASRGPYTKNADKNIMPLIFEIVDERPTYGYRRVCAVLNRRLNERELQPVNHKRVYRLMKQNGLLLAPIPHRHENNAHTGKISTETSNQRECLDIAMSETRSCR